MEVEAGVTPENELEDEIPSADPGNVPNIEAPRMRIIVCQASYGDTFGIEIDQEPPNSYSHVDRVTNGSRQFMLIDGGPATVRPTGTVGGERIPLQVCLFYIQLPRKVQCLIASDADSKLRICTECSATSFLLAPRASTPSW